jgi:Xaa-Pro aminopeptidase
MIMFEEKIYSQRREKLRQKIQDGIAVFLGNEETPMNYPANPFPFRQDSCFLYFFGLDSPGLAAVIDFDENRDVIYGDDVDIEDIIWMGSQPSMKEQAQKVGVAKTLPLAELFQTINAAKEKGRKIHYLPPYKPETRLTLMDLLSSAKNAVEESHSEELIKAVVEQRSFKIPEEIIEMEKALAATYDMYITAMKMARSGVYEREIVGRMEGIVLETGCQMAFPTILSINGQILHNHYHGNKLEEERLLVVDSGAESSLHYASDITRTIPVDGRFTTKQSEVYKIVLDAQKTAIDMIRPGIMYKKVHLAVAKVIATGLKGLGLMKGDVEEAVKAGAHALFFPHGLGHMMGLDVHDMENLGEDFVGYDETVKRSDQFGLAYLRLAKELKTDFVLTAEPGIYFIPALIDKWAGEKKLTEFINYDRLEEYKGFGGIRIEDDILVTEDGHRLLGKEIPKEKGQLEEIVAT